MEAKASEAFWENLNLHSYPYHLQISEYAPDANT